MSGSSEESRILTEFAAIVEHGEGEEEEREETVCLSCAWSCSSPPSACFPCAFSGSSSSCCCAAFFSSSQVAESSTLFLRSCYLPVSAVPLSLLPHSATASFPRSVLACLVGDLGAAVGLVLSASLQATRISSRGSLTGQRRSFVSRALLLLLRIKGEEKEGGKEADNTGVLIVIRMVVVVVVAASLFCSLLLSLRVSLRVPRTNGCLLASHSF